MTKVIHDTTIYYDSRDASFSLMNNKGEDLLLYMKAVSEPYAASADTMARLSAGASEFLYHCAQCHTPSITDRIEARLDTTAMQSLFSSDKPEVVPLNGIDYHAVFLKKKHSRYFLLTPYQRGVLFEYIQCVRASRGKDCSIVLRQGN